MLDIYTVDTIERARTGDPAVISKLYEQYHAGLFKYLYYRLGDMHTAEDLTSEVFLRMIRSLPFYRDKGVNIQAWLFQIARNLVIDHYRKANTNQHVELNDDLVSRDPDPCSSVESNLTTDQLRQALARLNDYQRDVLVLRFIACMPIAQVAQTLNKSEDTIKGLQRRGLIALRKIFDKKEVSDV